MTVMTLLSEFRPYDSIVCTSDAGREVVNKLWTHFASVLGKRLGRKLQFPVRLPLIPLGVDASFYRPSDKRESRERLGLPQERTILLCLGRLSISTKMDLFPILMAFSRIATEHEGRLLLTLAGDDTEDNTAPLLREFAHELVLGRHPDYCGRYD